MRLEAVVINKYRSIDKIKITLPRNKPLVLFGPNNAGKSNILSAINRLLGDRYPSYIEMLDSDYYMRDKEKYPESKIFAKFDECIHSNRNGSYNIIAVTYSYENGVNNSLIHDSYGNRLYLSGDDRAKCQSFLIDAERNINSSFNYSSRYSLLSKFSHKIHEALSGKSKDELSEAFTIIKKSFENTKEFSDFFDAFSSTLKNSVKGFIHSLAVDFSAYDPNNYANSLRIYAKEGDSIRGFEEFGTGEQQVLLMAFVKAYMQVFTAESFVLIIEEPEAHLHPLAQRWLKEYITEMCSSGIQVILSTHSADFIDVDYLEGLVRVRKINGVTTAIQLSVEQLFEICVKYGVPKDKTSPQNIIDFYSTKLFPDQLRGMFAETIVLVEGATEYYTLPVYLKNMGFSMAEHGVEIVNCGGKSAIPLFWRLFKAYGYYCFAVFDCDSESESTKETFKGLIDDEDLVTGANEFVVKDDYAYFGKNFEKYFRYAIKNYAQIEQKVSEEYHITSKPGIAKAVAQISGEATEFIQQMIEKISAKD